jgi:hypothetical protein
MERRRRDREFALKAVKDLADFQEHRLDRSCCPVIVVVGGLGFGFQLCHFSLALRKCSAASWPRSPLTDKSR